jgi:hypothetical protein
MGREEKDKRRDDKRVEETNVEYFRSYRQPRYCGNAKRFEEIKKRENQIRIARVDFKNLRREK